MEIHYDAPVPMGAPGSVKKKSLKAKGAGLGGLGPSKSKGRAFGKAIDPNQARKAPAGGQKPGAGGAGGAGGGVKRRAALGDISNGGGGAAGKTGPVKPKQKLQLGGAQLKQPSAKSVVQVVAAPAAVEPLGPEPDDVELPAGRLGVEEEALLEAQRLKASLLPDDLIDTIDGANNDAMTFSESAWALAARDADLDAALDAIGAQGAYRAAPHHGPRVHRERPCQSRPPSSRHIFSPAPPQRWVVITQSLTHPTSFPLHHHRRRCHRRRCYHRYCYRRYCYRRYCYRRYCHHCHRCPHPSTHPRTTHSPYPLARRHGRFGPW